MTIPSGIKKGFSMMKLNTFGLDVTAQYFIETTDIESLKSVFRWSRDNEIPHFILGGGSNVLLTKDLNGVVIKNALKGIEKVAENNETIQLKVGGGMVWHDLVMYAVKNGWGGIENLSLIPGSVGAAPMQNIGAYGVEIKDVFDSLEALNLKTLEVETFNKEECQFGYRESAFKNELRGQYFVTSVTLKLSKKAKINTSYGAINEVLSEKGINRPSIQDVSNAVIEIRQSKLPDPARVGNSGSFFKNPVIDLNDFEKLKSEYPNIPSYPQENGDVKVPAGWLIEQCGWKGKMRGNIGVHDKQALVLVNQGGGKGADIWQLAMDIQQSVNDKFGIEIETEVNIY